MRCLPRGNATDLEWGISRGGYFWEWHTTISSIDCKPVVFYWPTFINTICWTRWKSIISNVLILVLCHLTRNHSALRGIYILHSTLLFCATGSINVPKDINLNFGIRCVLSKPLNVERRHTDNRKRRYSGGTYLTSGEKGIYARRLNAYKDYVLISRMIWRFSM
jgi:hypothetical protein